VYRHAVIASLAAGLVLAAAGCGSDESPDGTPSPSPQPAVTSTSPRAAAEAKAIAAYNAMWQAMAKAGEVPDPDAPELRQYADGDALRGVVGALVTYRETGVVTRGAPVTTPRVDSVSPSDNPTQVDLVDCGDSTNWTTHKKSTGELIKEDPRGRRRITASVRLVGDTWKVNKFDAGAIGSC